MLHNLNWLVQGQVFPPLTERPRIHRYLQNEALFDGDHFDPGLDAINGVVRGSKSMYQKCAERITRIVGNFEEEISFPVLLNYQRLITLKMADLVCGEYPHISGVDAFENAALKDVRDYSDFDVKLYSAVLDISRYGEAVQRIYLDGFGRRTFTNWDPKEWYPVVSQDGTNTITHHCLCWRENRSEDPNGLNPDWYLHVQVHGTGPEEVGGYIYKVFKLASNGFSITEEISSTRVSTGLDVCAVQQLKAFSTTSTVYGYDDYMVIDSILAEIMTRIGQISIILDKHADPNITGPVSMLGRDPETGEYRLKTGKFFAVSPGEEQPKYMTWEGQLSSAFGQLEMLINQLYILSEMGSALLGSTAAGSEAVSGTAMRFKMVNPIAKARRISNSLTKSVRYLFAALSQDAEVVPEVIHHLERGMPEPLRKELPIPFRDISVFWYDGLPDDPRENIENAKLATGATKMMPLENAIMEYFGRTHEEALDWIARIRAESVASGTSAFEEVDDVPEEEAQVEEDPNHPGPQDGTGVNPNKKGSETGLVSFHGLNNT